MCKKCTGTSHDKEFCNVEKMGCEGCYYYEYKKEGGLKNEQKTCECANCESNKTNRRGG